MSYEGRSIHICPKGHLNELDCYDDFSFDPTDDSTETGQRIRRCNICGADLKYIGQVDDTNGEASARFYKKIVMKGSHKKEYDPITDKVTITCVPDICEIGYGNGEEWFNFDTGKKLD